MVNVKFEDGLNGHLLASFSIPAGLGHLLIALTRSHKDANERFELDVPAAMTTEEADKLKADKEQADKDEAAEHDVVVKQSLQDRKDAEKEARDDAKAAAKHK